MLHYINYFFRFFMDFSLDSTDTSSTDSKNAHLTGLEGNEGLLAFLPQQQYCYLCEISGWHDTLFCKQYDTVAKRNVRIKELRRCRRCIAAKHSEAACFETSPCYFCSADHNSVLCPVRDNKKNRFFMLGLGVPPVLTLDCVFCQDKGKHNTVFCTQYQTVDHRQARIRLLQGQICPKCLNQKHGIRGCKEGIACCFCTANHHSAVCPEREAKVELRIRLANGICQDSTEKLMYQQEHRLCEHEAYAISTYAKTLELELHKSKQLIDTQESHISLLEREIKDAKEFAQSRQLIKEPQPVTRFDREIPEEREFAQFRFVETWPDCATSNEGSKHEGYPENCFLCNDNHKADYCLAYNDPVRRAQRLRELKRCFGCMQEGHIQADCNRTKNSFERQNRAVKEFANKSGMVMAKRKLLTIPALSPKTKPCLFCASQHMTETCKKYGTPMRREIRLITLNRCTRCLHKGHSRTFCHSSYKCPQCVGIHHRVLCDKVNEPKGVQRKAMIANEMQQRYFVSTDTASSSHIRVQAPGRLQRYFENDERNLQCSEDDEDAEVLSYDNINIPDM